MADGYPFRGQYIELESIVDKRLSTMVWLASTKFIDVKASRPFTCDALLYITSTIISRNTKMETDRQMYWIRLISQLRGRLIDIPQTVSNLSELWGGQERSDTFPHDVITAIKQVRRDYKYWFDKIPVEPAESTVQTARGPGRPRGGKNNPRGGSTQNTRGRGGGRGGNEARDDSNVTSLNSTVQPPESTVQFTRGPGRPRGGKNTQPKQQRWACSTCGSSYMSINSKPAKNHQAKHPIVPTPSR